jgi:SAM-dependent methyltransferase
MSNARGKRVDTTYLSLDTAEERGFIHRDYIAHCLRWSHFIKFISQNKRYETATIVDIGCGRELPLAKTMYSSRYIPAKFHAVDVGPIDAEAISAFHSGKFPIEFHPKTDFVQWAKGRENTADFVTCFECLEHVEPKHMLEILAAIRSVLKPRGVAFFSTPCWDVVSCAANHVNEMRYEALGAVFEENGFLIQDVFGTFASIREYEPHLAPAHREVFEDLRAYYDVNFLACILAPFYPQYSRNCLWQVTPIKEGATRITRKFEPLILAPTPWGSSELWREMATYPDAKENNV